MADGSAREGQDGALPDNVSVDGKTMTVTLHADEAETPRERASGVASSTRPSRCTANAPSPPLEATAA